MSEPHVSKDGITPLKTPKIFSFHLLVPWNGMFLNRRVFMSSSAIISTAVHEQYVKEEMFQL